MDNVNMFFKKEALETLDNIKNDDGWMYSTDGKNIKFAHSLWEKIQYLGRHIFCRNEQKTKLDEALINLFPDQIKDLVRVINKEERVVLEGSKFCCIKIATSNLWQLEPDYVMDTYYSEELKEATEAHSRMQHEIDRANNAGNDLPYVDLNHLPNQDFSDYSKHHIVLRSAETAYKLLDDRKNIKSNEILNQNLFPTRRRRFI